jgi:hypothetical protein
MWTLTLLLAMLGTVGNSTGFNLFHLLMGLLLGQSHCLLEVVFPAGFVWEGHYACLPGMRLLAKIEMLRNGGAILLTQEPCTLARGPQHDGDVRRMLISLAHGKRAGQ